MDRSLAAQRPRLAAPQPADMVRAARRFLRGFRLRRRLAIALGLIVLLAGGLWFALRDSSLVSIQKVQIRGVHGVEAATIRDALTRAAHGQTTMHVRAGALMAAVAPYHVVKSLQITPQFPHGVRITVQERLPVAALVAGSDRTAVAADGTLLGPDLASATMPQISLGVLPPKRMTDPRILPQLAVLGAAPEPLAPRIDRVWMSPGGISVGMSNGPTIIFGDATRPHAKWAAAAVVLSDPNSAGASYVDVRTPERPAAGGLSVAASGLGSQVSTATDPTAAALASVLGAAVSGSSTAGTVSAGPAGTTGSGTTGAAATGSSGPAGASTTSATGASGSATGSPATSAPASGAGTASGASASPATGTSGASGTGTSSAGTGAGTTSPQSSTSTGG